MISFPLSTIRIGSIHMYMYESNNLDNFVFLTKHFYPLSPPQGGDGFNNYIKTFSKSTFLFLVHFCVVFGVRTVQKTFSRNCPFNNWFRTFRKMQGASVRPPPSSSLPASSWRVQSFSTWAAKSKSKNATGQSHEIFTFRFFLRISFPQAPECPLGPFQIFSKIRWDIHSSSGVVDTGSKWNKFDKGGAPCCKYLRDFLKQFKITLMLFGLGGRWFIKKTWSKKSRDTLPLKSTITRDKPRTFSMSKPRSKQV